MARAVLGGCRNSFMDIWKNRSDEHLRHSPCISHPVSGHRGNAQPLPVPSSCIFHSFYPSVFFSRPPAARGPDPGGQWRVPNWGHKREVPRPNGNFPFLLLLWDSVKWLGLWDVWRTPGHHSGCCSQEPAWKLSDRKIQYKNRPESPNCI